MPSSEPYASRCSRSMFVMTAMAGDNFRKDRSLSSASTTMYWPPAETRIAAERADTSADHGRRIQARTFEHERDHRRRRGLPMCAGHRNADAQAHQLGQHLGPRNDRDVAGPRLRHFRVVAGNRGRHDHDIGVADMTAVMAGHHADAERRQTIGDVGSASVGSADLVSEVHEQLSDPTHPDATHSYEMHASRAAQPHDSKK